MGRIKTKLIKRNALELIDKYRERFTTEFEDNKKQIMELAEVNSKKLRNVMAGYVTRLMRQKQDL